MKQKIINYLISILILVMIILRIIDKVYFNKFNNLLWIVVTIILFIFSLYLTFKLNFIQFRFITIIRSLKVKSINTNSSISNLESLSLSMAGRIGVGSLSGVAIAIYLGGPGVIFWMWVSSLIFSILTYCESYLGVKYQRKDSYCLLGGPSYYIKYGLNNNFLAILYSILIILAYIVGFLGIQSNTIVKSIYHISNINTLFITSILCIITMLVIFNTSKSIISITSKILPIMTIVYLLMGLYIIINNSNDIFSIFINIFKCSFNFKSGFISVILIGIQRGLFASESGIGSSAIASGSTNDTARNQGILQLFGVHFTTFIICTITALIVFNSNYQLIEGNINGIEIMILAFYQNFGKLGSYLLCLITILFAFSTIISGYIYGENSLKFLNNNISNIDLILFKIFALLLVFLGGILNSSIIWNIVDLFVLLLTIINVYSIYKLHKKVH
jgi:amino acid carrier protein